MYFVDGVWVRNHLCGAREHDTANPEFERWVSLQVLEPIRIAGPEVRILAHVSDPDLSNAATLVWIKGHQ